MERYFGCIARRPVEKEMDMIFTDLKRWALTVWVEAIKTKVVRNHWGYYKKVKASSFRSSYLTHTSRGNASWLWGKDNAALRIKVRIGKWK